MTLPGAGGSRRERDGRAVMSGVFLAELHPWALVDWERRVIR